MPEPNREAAEPKPDATVWYDDGNIVLIAGSTAFKLYKGILASVSPVFKDMFALAQPDGDAQTPSAAIDGCPAIRVTDSPGHLRQFLRVITTGCIELLDRSTLIPFAHLAAIVRIAHKYQAEQVLQAAGSRLRAFFAPNALAELHAAQPESGAAHDGGTSTWAGVWAEKQQACGVQVPMTGATGVEAVNIARLLGWDDVLPLALLLCCSCADPLELRNGVRGDGSGEDPGTAVRLSDGDYLGYVQAIPVLTRVLHMLGVRVIQECARDSEWPVWGCTTGVCMEVLEAMGDEYLREPFSGRLMDGFVWFQWRNEPPSTHKRCATTAICG